MFDLKIIIWTILSSILAVLIAFFFLMRRNRSGRTRHKHPSTLKSILTVVFLVIAVGTISYFLVSFQSDLNNVKFPSTGSDPTQQVLTQYIKDIYTTPFDGYVTLLLIIAIVFLAMAEFRNIKREKEIDKIKSEFISLASHQLRTPLTTISWYTEMILKGDVGEVVPSQKKYLEEIYQGNQRMVNLVNTLLDVSRIELGTTKVKSVQTDICTLVKSVLNEEKQEIEKKNLLVTENFSKDIPIFPTDPRLLRMVFANLLINAINYTPLGGRIECAISLEKEKTILVKISDTGYGIQKNQQSKIFTKFFRADNIIDKDGKGTGLGLYIVKSILKNFGGKIWFESEENKGTTFYVTLPLRGIK